LADEFRSFAKEWEFKISTCSPYHKQGNGKAESAVKIAKSLIKKSIESHTDIELALLIWRNTPNSMGTSPAQRLYSRRTRCPIPTAPELLLPKVVEGVKEKIIENKQRSKGYHDTKAREEGEFHSGEMVYVRLNDHSKKWVPGVVLNQVKPRSYTVEVNNRQYRRNSLHLKPAISHQSYKPLPSYTKGTTAGRDSSTIFQSGSTSEFSSRPSSLAQENSEANAATTNDSTISANSSFGLPSATSTPRMAESSREEYLTPRQFPTQPA
jgi:hypothetical protein